MSMILTCPRCATRYLVDDLQVWASGRTVQCDECGRRWRAAGAGVRPAPPHAPPEPFIAEPAERPPQFRRDDRSPSEAHEPPAAQMRPVAEMAASDGGGALFAPARPKRRTPATVAHVRQTRLLVLLGWGAALLLVVALAWAVARREEVVRAIPATAGVYSAVGLASGSGGPSR